VEVLDASTSPPKESYGRLARFLEGCRRSLADDARATCWVHKTANVLAKLPKSQQPKAKRALQEIWMAEDQGRR
jgi:transposase-like protein